MKYCLIGIIGTNFLRSTHCILEISVLLFELYTFTHVSEIDYKIKDLGIHQIIFHDFPICVGRVFILHTIPTCYFLSTISFHCHSRFLFKGGMTHHLFIWGHKDINFLILRKKMWEPSKFVSLVDGYNKFMSVTKITS